MTPNFAKPGAATSTVEVSHISVHGFWLLLEDEELYLPFKLFPWFKRATVEQIVSVSLPGPGHLYWPDLDIDLAVGSIRDPDAFPLVSKAPSSNMRESGKLET